MIEDHIGELYGEPSTMTGELNATWPGGSDDAETDKRVFGAGTPAP